MDVPQLNVPQRLRGKSGQGDALLAPRDLHFAEADSYDRAGASLVGLHVFPPRRSRMNIGQRTGPILTSSTVTFSICAPSTDVIVMPASGATNGSGPSTRQRRITTSRMSSSVSVPILKPFVGDLARQSSKTMSDEARRMPR